MQNAKKSYEKTKEKIADSALSLYPEMTCEDRYGRLIPIIKKRRKHKKDIYREDLIRAETIHT